MTGHGWQRSDHEMSIVGDRKETYTIRMGLHQANITLTVMNVTDETLIDFHNVKIGWVERKLKSILYISPLFNFLNFAFILLQLSNYVVLVMTSRKA